MVTVLVRKFSGRFPSEKAKKAQRKWYNVLKRLGGGGGIPADKKKGGRKSTLVGMLGDERSKNVLN